MKLGHLFFISVDPSLGKIDKASFSQQTLMELFADGITNREVICGSKESPKDISQWKNVKFSNLKEITIIEFFYLRLKGSVDLKWLPESLKEVYLLGNSLTGTVDLTCLPGELLILSLAENNFEGTINLTRLPPKMQKLYLLQNNFYGKTDFTQLPKSLTCLSMEKTNLDGEIYVFKGILVTANSGVKDLRKR